jgi:hypothetical protein
MFPSRHTRPRGPALLYAHTHGRSAALFLRGHSHTRPCGPVTLYATRTGQSSLCLVLFYINIIQIQILIHV